MAKINTLNYQTVAAWNGSQDLFVVEQPDGTKVATPAMVKQFIEAGDFTATGEITDGHGNILKDMAKSADVNTALAGKQDTLTFDNVPTQNSNNPVKSGGIYSKIGDLTQTGLTGDSVAAQLSGSLSPIDAIVKRFYINNGNTSLDTGINVNQTHTTGFVAIVSTFGTYNAGVASVYIGGVAHRKQDGTVGDINSTRLGGIGIGGSSDGANMQFSVVNDKLQLRTYQYQVGACVTLILSKR